MNTLLVILGFAAAFYLGFKKKESVDAYDKGLPQTPETYQYEKVIKAWKDGEFELNLFWSKETNIGFLKMTLPDGRYDKTEINADLYEIFRDAGVPEMI